MKIDSIDDPRIAPYLSLRNLKSQFVTEGKKGVATLFESKLHIESLLYEKKHEALALSYQKERPELELFCADETIISQIVGYKMHQGIMALAPIPVDQPLDQLEGSAIVLQGLANAENVGAILRSAAAFGISNIICDEACSPLYLRRTVKTSMGAIFSLNTFKSMQIVKDLGALKKRGYKVVGADPAQENTPLREAKMKHPLLLVIGSEGDGISQEVKAVCDELVCIPIDPSIDSLNASIASSIFMYTFSLY